MKESTFKKVINRISTIINRSEKETESFWKEAIKIAEKKFQHSSKLFNENEYKFVIHAIKEMTKKIEKYDISKFLESNNTANEFIESAIKDDIAPGSGPSVTSGQFNIPTTILHKDDGEDEDSGKQIDQTITSITGTEPQSVIQQEQEWGFGEDDTDLETQEMMSRMGIGSTEVTGMGTNDFSEENDTLEKPEQAIQSPSMSTNIYSREKCECNGKCKKEQANVCPYCGLTYEGEVVLCPNCQKQLSGLQEKK